MARTELNLKNSTTTSTRQTELDNKDALSTTSSYSCKLGVNTYII